MDKLLQICPDFIKKSTNNELWLLKVTYDQILFTQMKETQG
jgi:hypothetical protein